MEIPGGAAPGPYGVTASCLKRGRSFMFMRMSEVFGQSMREGDIPRPLKEALVSPNWKGGDKCVPANYRPVSLMNHIRAWKGLSDHVLSTTWSYMASLIRGNMEAGQEKEP